MSAAADIVGATTSYRHAAGGTIANVAASETRYPTPITASLSICFSVFIRALTYLLCGILFPTLLL